MGKEAASGRHDSLRGVEEAVTRIKQGLLDEVDLQMQGEIDPAEARLMDHDAAVQMLPLSPKKLQEARDAIARMAKPSEDEEWLALVAPAAERGSDLLVLLAREHGRAEVIGILREIHRMVLPDSSVATSLETALEKIQARLYPDEVKRAKPEQDTEMLCRLAREHGRLEVVGVIRHIKAHVIPGSSTDLSMDIALDEIDAWLWPEPQSSLRPEPQTAESPSHGQQATEGESRPPRSPGGSTGG